MRISVPKKEFRHDVVRFSATVDYDTPRKIPASELWFEFPAKFAPLLSLGPEPFLVALLLLGMKRGEDIYLDQPISSQLLDGLEKYQTIFGGWAPKSYRPVKIIAPRSDSIESRQSKLNACAFSGGTDSFYTLWDHLPQAERRPERPVHYALFMHGFDVYLRQPEVFDSWAKKYDRLMESLGVTLLTGRTNIREFQLNWTHSHGTALVAAALFFSPQIGSLLIPSSRTPGKRAIVLGSDPKIDHLLSTERLAIIHDDDSLTKFDKLKRMGDWQPLHDNLRVCWELPQADFNCSRCSKCAFTMTMLDVLGRLSNYRTFRSRRRSDYRSVRYDLPHQRRCAYEILGLAHQQLRRDIMLDVLVAMLRTTLFGGLAQRLRRFREFSKFYLYRHAKRKNLD
ncbi:MAG: hypothetical protein V1738_00300 [Patescibacteria group bacterium]